MHARSNFSRESKKELMNIEGEKPHAAMSIDFPGRMARSEGFSHASLIPMQETLNNENNEMLRNAAPASCG
jgi:hypothetical protein